MNKTKSFDNLDHELTLQAIKKHTDCKWIILYVERWMKSPIQLADGSKVVRKKGVPQGGSITPPTMLQIFLFFSIMSRRVW
ncbi:MAG: hypothetical protein ACEY3H_06185 [Wolbachia sp.]